MEPPHPITPKSKSTAWNTLGFTEEGQISAATIPPQVLVVAGPIEDEDFRLFFATLPGPPTLFFRRDGSRFSAYRFVSGVAPVADLDLPACCKLFRPGDNLPLPEDDLNGDRIMAKTIADLPEITEACGLVERLPPPAQQTSLSKFSLLGRASEFEANVVLAEPLLGNVCSSGQASVWYGPPNAGKTLIGLSLLREAIDRKRVEPGNVFYINADDSSAGFAVKMRLMDDLGVHTLSPGHQGFECSKLAEHMHRAVREGTAKGIFIIIDTLKKFADLMNKAQSAAFADACRQFVMNGGTILAFAHTNKNATATGKLTYTGTADIVQDFDSAYILTPLEGEDSKTDRVVKFEAIKRRGSGVEATAYRYAAEDDISYEERLVSVAEVDPQWFDAFERAGRQHNDAEVIAAIEKVIGLGVTKKMELARTVAKRLQLQVSERRILEVLKTYTGDDPERHRWSFEIKDRGAKVYALLDRPDTG